MINFDDFKKLDLRIGKVLEAKEHPNADKLFLLKVDIGEKTIQLVAGIKKAYSAQELVGKNIVVVANLQPRPLRGELSEGMLLAASNDEEGPVLICPEKPIKPGSSVR